MKSIHDQIWETALKKIQVRPMSTYELQKKLLSKYPEEEEMMEKVVKEMENVQLINDHHLIQKPIGKIKIMAECRRRGLDSNQVEHCLLNEEWNESESIEKSLSEKERTLNENDPRKRKMKIMMFLQSRGFRTSLIYRHLSE